MSLNPPAKRQKIDVNADFEDTHIDPNIPHYKTIKTSLASVFKIPTKLPVISEAAATVNKIIIRSLLFLRLYLLHKRDNPPAVTTEFISNVFRTICLQKPSGGPRTETAIAMRENLTSFYKEIFEPLLPADDQPILYTNLTQVLSYAAKQLKTVFENNINQHFVDYVESYVNAVWQKDFLVKKIKKIKKRSRSRHQKAVHHPQKSEK